MEALAGCTRLSSLNGCSQYQQILAGGIESLDIDKTELAMAIGPFLLLSASTLTSLEIW
jgi:hypothetical protein